jgi:hypothetical protein
MNSLKNFSGFSLPEAYKLLGIESLPSWQFQSHDRPPSDFFKQRLQRLKKTLIYAAIKNQKNS